MADKIDPKRLSDLNDRLNAKKSVSKKETKHEDHYSGAQLGWRMGNEIRIQSIADAVCMAYQNIEGAIEAVDSHVRGDFAFS